MFKIVIFQTSNAPEYVIYVFPGWLEPMAQRIKDNPHTVTIPMIDSISDRTLEFYGHPGGISVSVGGFTWYGHVLMKILKHNMTTIFL